MITGVVFDAVAALLQVTLSALIYILFLVP